MPQSSWYRKLARVITPALFLLAVTVATRAYVSGAVIVGMVLAHVLTDGEPASTVRRLRDRSRRAASFRAWRTTRSVRLRSEEGR